MEFNELYYLASNPDVAEAVKIGNLTSGLHHWEKYGKYEKRRTYPLQRYEIINLLIKNRNYKKYLEIGVDACECFNRIEIQKKIGVDIVACPCEHTFQISSDDFFLRNENKFDIIFIDGLHEDAQALRDIENSVRNLNKSGLIMLHDCLPPDEWHAREVNDGGSWNGTVWKSALKYFSQNESFYCYIIDADWGCGIIDTSIKPWQKLKMILPNEILYNEWFPFLKKNYAITETEFIKSMN